jgi:hypothetical protein
LNTKILVDHIESNLPCRIKMNKYEDVHLRCADFSAYLRTYFMKERPAD